MEIGPCICCQGWTRAPGELTLAAAWTKECALDEPRKAGPVHIFARLDGAIYDMAHDFKGRHYTDILP